METPIQNRAMVKLLPGWTDEIILLGMVGKSVAQKSGTAPLRVVFRGLPTVLPGTVKIHATGCGGLYRRMIGV